MPDDFDGSDLTKCDEELPLLGVTREFDFGQFIELFDSTPDPIHPDVPIVSRIVIQPSSTLASDRASAQQTSSPLMASSNGIVSAGGREVNLFTLTERGPGAKLSPLRVEIADASSFFDSGKITVNGRSFKITVDDSIRNALQKGLTVTTFADVTERNKKLGSVPLSFTLAFEPVSLAVGDLTRVLAGGKVQMGIGDVKPFLDSGAIRALLAGNTVLTHGVSLNGKTLPIELRPTVGRDRPLTSQFEVFDLPTFLADPSVIGSRGERFPLNLNAEHVRELIEVGRTKIQWQDESILLEIVTDTRRSDFTEFEKLRSVIGSDVGIPPVKSPGTTWPDFIKKIEKIQKPNDSNNYYFADPNTPSRPQKFDGSGSTGPSVSEPSMTDRVQPRLPSGTGLPVAVFVPWRQTWTLKGFSRGNLLHSIALAPMEQVTLQVFSWERRTRSLDQSSETEVDQSTEITNTTRDTEDVFREMIAKRDFAWQLSGSLDASYNNGVASIQVGIDGSVSNTTNIQETARNSSQHIRESTIKASARVRSRRVTRITQTVETGREERVTRLIRNPNQCHTLTLDFFEALAHYEISLEFMPQRLRLVVLIPNPVKHREFSSEIVRRNETTLRNALIEPALVDGFDACRFVAAYDEAKNLLPAQRVVEAKTEEIQAQRAQPSPQNTTDPAAPQQAEVERIVAEMITALTKIREEADINPALEAIRAHNAVTENMRRKGQYWLFINFCSAKFPAVLSTLDELSKSGVQATVENAQKIMAVLPRPDAPTNLGNLNDMSDKDKEEFCIAGKLRDEQPKGNRLYMRMDWDWGWWTGRMREEGLYTANDAGLGGLAGQLPRAFEAWEAKKAQGAAMKDQDIAKTEAEGRQDKATTADKLEMAFPLDELAKACERQKVLRDHLNEHRDFYNYALFQALPPGEQALRIVEASNGKLQVGLFEPRVVALNGDRLAVPLTPFTGSSTLQNFLTDLRDDLAGAFEQALNEPDTAILPTPGVTVSSRLGKCSGCEEYIEEARRHELMRLEAIAKQESWEATRRQKLIEEDKNYTEFRAITVVTKHGGENTPG